MTKENTTGKLRLVSRRQTLAAIAGAGAFFIPAWNETVEAADSIVCVATTPTVTEGPYWVDEKLFRSDIRTDPGTGLARAGIPLTLKIGIQNLANSGCTPLTGAYVDIWHCDAKGIYSDEPTYNPGGGTGSVNTSGQKFLRGYQITDGVGQVTFTTIYPGWYSGRTIHIHIRVRTYSGNTVLSNFVSQIFFDETSNNAVLATSAYTRSTARDTTNARDGIYNVANQTRMLATTTGDNNGGYTASIVMGAAFNTPAAVAPSISLGGIGNALGGAAGVSPGTWISIYGSNLAAAPRQLSSSDLVNNVIPTTLGGVSVRINGKAGFLGYIGPTQINVLAPSDAGRGSVAVTVSNTAGTSNSVMANMSDVLPGLAEANGYVRAVRYPDNAIVNGTGAAETGYTTVAAAVPGDVLSFFGTGFGPVDQQPQDGLVFAGAYPTTNEVRVTIGGLPAEVIWAGLSGAGLYQINVVVPSLNADDHVVIARVAGVESQSTAKLKVAAGAARAKPRSTALLAARLSLHGRKRKSIEDVISLGGLFGPAQHPDAGAILARASDHDGALVALPDIKTA